MTKLGMLHSVTFDLSSSYKIIQVIPNYYFYLHYRTIDAKIPIYSPGENVKKMYATVELLLFCQWTIFLCRKSKVNPYRPIGDYSALQCFKPINGMVNRVLFNNCHFCSIVK